MAYKPFPNKKGRNWRQQQLEIPLLTWLLDLPRHGQVLEVGCGCGVGLPIIAERCRPARLVGIDFDADALAEARSTNHGLRAELLRSDVRTMPFEDGSFDVVVDFGTCYHVVRPWEALEEISRVLCDGGSSRTRLRSTSCSLTRSDRACGDSLGRRPPTWSRRATRCCGQLAGSRRRGEIRSRPTAPFNRRPAHEL